MDISFHLFQLITTGELAVQNFRFGALITQALPLAAIHAGLSLKAVALIYSLAFPLLHLAVFLLCLAWLHQPSWALVILGLQVFMVTDTFYWIQSELPQGLAFLVLYFAALSRAATDVTFAATPAFQIWQATGLFILAFIHPLVLFPFAFIWIFLLITRQLDRRTLLVSGIGFLLFYTIRHRFFQTDYDNQSMEGMSGWMDLLPGAWSLPSNRIFLREFFQDYYLLPAGLLVLAVLAVRNRAWWPVVLATIAVTGYALLVNLSYPDHTVKFYRENLHLPLGVFVVVPLVFADWTQTHPRWLTPVLIGLFLLRVGHIQVTHRLYSGRLDWMRSTMDRLEAKGVAKAVIPEPAVPMDTVLMSWATPYEFWLLSTLDRGRTASVLVTDQPEDFRWALGDPGRFIARWGVFPYAGLPKAYFRFPDSTSGYTVVDELPAAETGR